MLQDFLLMADIQATQLIFILVGLGLRRLKLMSDELRNGLSSLMVNLFLPCMVLDSFAQDIGNDQLLGAMGLLGVAAGMCAVAIGVGKLLYGRKPRDHGTVLRYGTMIPNAGFAGIPLMRDAFGQMGAFYASIFVIPIRACIWSVGVAMFSVEKEPHRIRKILLNPCLVTVYIGLIRLVTHFPVPGFLDRAIASIGDCCGSVSMIFIGGVLADTHLKGLFSKEIFSFSFVRLVLMPGLTLLILRLIRFDPVMSSTAVVLMGMPMAATAPVLATKYHANAKFAAQCLFVSTFLSLITIPLWSALVGA